MHPYLIEMQNNPGRAIDLYRWNAELSSLFWPLISVTEVSLRNAVDESLGQFCQNNGGHRDWLLYIDQAPLDLKDEFGGKARTFRGRAEDAKKIRDTGTGLVIGSHPRKRPLNQRRRERLWNAVIRQAFLSNVQPHALAADLNRLRLFRNRMAHVRGTAVCQKLPIEWSGYHGQSQ